MASMGDDFLPDSDCPVELAGVASASTHGSRADTGIPKRLVGRLPGLVCDRAPDRLPVRAVPPPGGYRRPLAPGCRPRAVVATRVRAKPSIADSTLQPVRAKGAWRYRLDRFYLNPFRSRLPGQPRTRSSIVARCPGPACHLRRSTGPVRAPRTASQPVRSWTPHRRWDEFC